MCGLCGSEPRPYRAPRVSADPYFTGASRVPAPRRESTSDQWARLFGLPYETPAQRQALAEQDARLKAAKAAEEAKLAAELEADRVAREKLKAFEVGDLIEVSLGEEKIVGRAVATPQKDGLRVGAHTGATLIALLRKGWEAKLKSRPIPTEDGVFLDSDGDLWELEGGLWHFLDDDDPADVYEDSEVGDYAPFVRVVDVEEVSA